MLGDIPNASNDKLILTLITLLLKYLRPLPKKFYFQKLVFNSQIQQLQLKYPLQSITAFWSKYFGLNVWNKDSLFVGLTNIKLYVSQMFGWGWKDLKKNSN